MLPETTTVGKTKSAVLAMKWRLEAPWHKKFYMGICAELYSPKPPNHPSVLPLVRHVPRTLRRMTVYLLDGAFSSLYHLADGFPHTSMNYHRLLSYPLGEKRRHPRRLYPSRCENVFLRAPKEDGAVRVACRTHHGHGHDCVNGRLHEQSQYPHWVLVADSFGVHRVSDGHSIAHVGRIVVAPQQSQNPTRGYQSEKIVHTRPDRWIREDTFAPPAVDKRDDPDSPSPTVTSDAEEASSGAMRGLYSHVVLRDRNHARVAATSYAPSRGHARVRSLDD